MSKPGYVYALINPSMPGLVKVGRTERDPTVRVSELSGVTGVATPFILVFHQAFVDCELAERHAHAALERQGRRFAANREFFEVEPTTAVHAILAAPGTTTLVPLDRQEAAAPAPATTHLVDEMVERAHRLTWGIGDTPEDIKEAIKLYEKAGKLGSAKAYLELAEIYSLGVSIKRNENKANQNYRIACEMNYPPAWAAVAENRRRSKDHSGEARAWQKFFDLVLPHEEMGEGILIKASGFLDARESLELSYFPCNAKVGGTVVEGAVEFMRQHADEMEEHVQYRINNIEQDRGDFYFGRFMGDTKKDHIAACREVIRWLQEL